MMVYCLAYSLTITMKATCSSEMSVDFQCITRRYKAECCLCAYLIKHHIKNTYGGTAPSFLILALDGVQ
jgi:hypothetical protein